MKTHNNTFFSLSLLLLILILSGCDEENFLDQQNPNAITTDTFWKSENQFNAGLTTVYGALQFRAVSGGEQIYEMVMGDIAGTQSWYRPFAFRNFNINDGTYYVTDKWNELYIGIFRANQVIQKIQIADESIFSENSKAEIEAQARFLRAFFYFQIAHTYGEAVIQTTVPETSEDINKPLSSIEEVTTTVIIPDLEFARKNLPESWDENNTGKVTWGSATSLLGKVHLYNENWTTAKDLFAEVINSGNYSLTPKIMDNFTHENELNSESIFEVAFSAELSPGAHGDIVDDSMNQPGGAIEIGAEATALANAFGQLQFGGYNTLLPTYYLHELFWYDEVDSSNPINNGNLQSKRMTASIVPINGEGSYYGLSIGEKPGWSAGQSAYIKKHTNWYHLSAEDTDNRSGINFRHIRLADVYLMYAEAAINATGNFNTAITYIDLVRKRAGVKTLQQYMDENGGNIPQLHVSVQVHGAHPMVPANAENILTHIQRVERPLELCFEGHRWKDLVRWGIVAEVFNELRADEIWRQNNTDVLNVIGTGVSPLFIMETIRPDFVIAADVYTPSQHNYLPIPSGEIQINNGL